MGDDPLYSSELYCWKSHPAFTASCHPKLWHHSGWFLSFMDILILSRTRWVLGRENNNVWGISTDSKIDSGFFEQEPTSHLMINPPTHLGVPISRWPMITEGCRLRGQGMKGLATVSRDEDSPTKTITEKHSDQNLGKTSTLQAFYFTDQIQGNGVRKHLLTNQRTKFVGDKL